MLTEQLRNRHLLWRCGFGIDMQNMVTVNSNHPKQLYAGIEKASLAAPAYINVAENEYAGMFTESDKMASLQDVNNGVSAEKKKQLRIQSRENLKSLALHWMDTMVTTDAQLREKMALFWHGHFASRIINIYYQQLLLNSVRENALGSFGDLLKSVSKSASMLQFLNNQQNRKAHPNENFAREVMELFTLGHGNYTETDVKEAARAFTGWGFNINGEFVFRPFFHDKGIKTFLGRQGNFDGDDILNILLEQKQTAIFITKKIYRYFVNEQHVNEEQVQWLANRFYNSSYNIQGLMNDIFTSEWFYDEKNIAQKIKSPVELIVGIRRLLPTQFDSPEIQILFQRILGQLLFFPPNVAGWPGGKAWIDSSSLMLRLRMPQLIAANSDFSVRPKEDDDQQMGMQENFTNMAINSKPSFSMQAHIDWSKYVTAFKDVPERQLYSYAEALVLQTKAGSVNRNAVMGITDTSSRESYIKTLTVAFMSTPEYQLC